MKSTVKTHKQLKYYLILLVQEVIFQQYLISIYIITKMKQQSQIQVSFLEINVSSKQVEELSTETASMMEAFDQKGNKYYAKIVNKQRSINLGYAQCLQFNEEIFQDVSSFPFRENFLDIKTLITNQDCRGFVTEPYQCNLMQYLVNQDIDERQIMNIFAQIVRAVYSLIAKGYWHRNIRAEHFVKCGQTWKLQSVVYNEDYSQASGSINQYLWSSKHEPPEYIAGRQYQQEDYNRMTVWNLGCILLQMILKDHKLSNAGVINKFKGKPFTLQAIGEKPALGQLSQGTKSLLALLLHHDPKQRMKLIDLFLNESISSDVAFHAVQNKQLIPLSKVVKCKNSIVSKANVQSMYVLDDVIKTMNEKQLLQRKSLIKSKIGSIIQQQEFFDGLHQLSVTIPKKNDKDRKRNTSEIMNQLFDYKEGEIRQTLQLYKSYMDQSQLLVFVLQNIDKLEFYMFHQDAQVKEIILLTKYSVLFVSLMNLNALAEGFNRNKNILDIDGNEFSKFQKSAQYQILQKYLNFKRFQRGKELDNIRFQINNLTQKQLAKDAMIVLFLQKNFRRTDFSQIKNTYRFILKYPYDAISQQYNKNKTRQLAQRGMLISYCIAIDKLYIKEHIQDNFKYYFQWIEKQPCNYVPLHSFKNYIFNAPKEILIQHSMFVLKKYFKF